MIDKYLPLRGHDSLRRIAVAAATFFLIVSQAHAQKVTKAGDAFNLNIHVSGSVIIKDECQFADPANVEFGDVYIENISSGTYVRPVDYRLKCSPSTQSSSVNVIFSGMKSHSDSSLFATDVSGLSIRLANGEKQINPGERSKLNIDSSSDLTVELVKQAGASLPAGSEFYSIIAMTLDVD